MVTCRSLKIRLQDVTGRNSRRVEIIGHRGQVDGPPENTLDAVETALHDGADGIEVDVRLTADGIPVCVHDPDLRGLTGHAAAVSSVTYRQLRGVPLDEDHRIPALADVLALARGRGVVVLDLKDNGGDPAPLVDRTLEAIARTQTHGVVVLSSFSAAALQIAARRDQALPRALITSTDVPLAEAAKQAQRLGCEGVHPRLRAVLDDPNSVTSCRRGGLRVRPWTVNRPVDAVCLDALGVDAVITDEPGRLRAATRAPVLIS